jgi:hypothetical protein
VGDAARSAAGAAWESGWTQMLVKKTCASITSVMWRYQRRRAAHLVVVQAQIFGVFEIFLDVEAAPRWPAPSAEEWCPGERKRGNRPSPGRRTDSAAAAANAVHPLKSDARSARLPSRRAGDLWCPHPSRAAANPVRPPGGLPRSFRPPAGTARQESQSRPARHRPPP